MDWPTDLMRVMPRLREELPFPISYSRLHIIQNILEILSFISASKHWETKVFRVFRPLFHLQETCKLVLFSPIQIVAEMNRGFV